MKTILLAVLAAMTFAVPALASSSTAFEWASKATSAELQEVKGIGPVISQRIKAAAPFSSDSDLKDRVRGVGPVLLQRMTEKAKGTPSPPKN